MATAVAGAAHQLVQARVLAQVVAAAKVMAVAVAVAADSVEALAPRTQVSRAKTLATDNRQSSHAQRMHRASAMHEYRESTRSSSAKTHVARALTHAQTCTTTLTNASLPAMCLQAFHHLACLPEAVAGVAAVAIAVVAGILVAAVCVQVAVATGVILVEGLGVDSSSGSPLAEIVRETTLGASSMCDAPSLLIAFSDQWEIRREAADSALTAKAKQQHIVLIVLIWKWNYILPGNQVAIPGKNHSSNTITHISRKNGRVTLAM